MTTSAATRHVAPPIFAGRYRRLRTAHPVSVLRWLRNTVLLCVLAAALLYLWVATQAGDDIDAASRTRQAVADIGQASSAARLADKALRTVFYQEDVTLVGTGSQYVDHITAVSKYLTLAAGNNAAGAGGTSGIQFAQDQLAAYLQLSENAVRDYGASRQFGQVAETYASQSNQEMASALSSLQGTENNALKAQLGAWPLDPRAFWLALLGPVVGMLLLVGATAHVLARYFRRHVSRWLWCSLLVTAATTVTVGLFNASDEQHLSPNPWAGHPVTLTCALLLFLQAAVLAYLAYRPRLAEYRFESS